MNLKIKDNNIYKLRDLDFLIEFTLEYDILTPIYISYFILNPDKKIIYSDSDYLEVNEKFLFEKNLDNRQAQEIEVPEGEYTLGVNIKYLDKEKSFTENFKIKKISNFLYSLKQLFDIKLTLENQVLMKPEELSAKVVFENFGSEATPVNLTFFVYDNNDKEVYRSEKSTVVRTEQVIFEDFSGIDIPPGKYKVILRTLYNVGVEDYFKADFELMDKIELFPLIVLLLLLLIGGYFIVRNKK